MLLHPINAPMVDDSDLVAITLNGLDKEYKNFDTSIAVRGGNPPDFDELCSLLITELGLGTSSSTSTHTRDQAFYSRVARGRGRFSFRGRENSQGWQAGPPNFQNWYGARGGGGRNTYSSSRGRTGVTGAQGRGRWQSQQQNASGIECHYCGKLGHMVKDC